MDALIEELARAYGHAYRAKAGIVDRDFDLNDLTLAGIRAVLSALASKDVDALPSADEIAMATSNLASVDAGTVLATVAACRSRVAPILAAKDAALTAAKLDAAMVKAEIATVAGYLDERGVPTKRTTMRDTTHPYSIRDRVALMHEQDVDAFDALESERDTYAERSRQCGELEAMLNTYGLPATPKAFAGAIEREREANRNKLDEMNRDWACDVASRDEWRLRALRAESERDQAQAKVDAVLTSTDRDIVSAIDPNAPSVAFASVRFENETSGDPLLEAVDRAPAATLSDAEQMEVYERACKEGIEPFIKNSTILLKLWKRAEERADKTEHEAASERKATEFYRAETDKLDARWRGHYRVRCGILALLRYPKLTAVDVARDLPAAMPISAAERADLERTLSNAQELIVQRVATAKDAALAPIMAELEGVRAVLEAERKTCEEAQSLAVTATVELTEARNTIVDLEARLSDARAGLDEVCDERDTAAKRIAEMMTTIAALESKTALTSAPADVKARIEEAHKIWAESETMRQWYSVQNMPQIFGRSTELARDLANDVESVLRQTSVFEAQIRRLSCPICHGSGILRGANECELDTRCPRADEHS